MNPVYFIPFYLLIGYLTSRLAKHFHRRAYVWFYLGFFFGVFAPLTLMFLPKLNPPVEPKEPTKEPLPFKPREWYYLDSDHNQVGPISFSALCDAYQSNHVNKATYIWNEDMKDWAPISVSPFFKDFS